MEFWASIFTLTFVITRTAQLSALGAGHILPRKRVVGTRLYIYIYVYVHIRLYRFQNIFLRCPTPKLHCFPFSHWPSFRFLSFMAFFIPYIQFFFGLPRTLFCFGIHFNAVLGSLHSAILWIWPYNVSLILEEQWTSGLLNSDTRNRSLEDL